ncbi:MAG: hypothetical protein L6408_02385 [Nanoarchaeota archaeon]|nr:hypothetical protein [Nanoarchaeota archaeon]
MKLPKTFCPDKDLEDTIARLLRGEKIPTDEGFNIFAGAEVFLKKQNSDTNFLDKYVLAQNIAKDLDYGWDDLDFYAKGMIMDHMDSCYLGFYLSALTNKIIKKTQTKSLSPNNDKLWGVGAFMSQGSLYVKNSVSEYAGYRMKGGSMVIQGFAWGHLGCEMKGGSLYLNGDCDDYTGKGMQGGLIWVFGNIGRKTGLDMANGVIRAHGSIADISK